MGAQCTFRSSTYPTSNAFARARGFVRRGDEIDAHNAAGAYLRAFGEAKFGRITLRRSARGRGVSADAARKRRNAREREQRRLVRLHRYEDAARANGHRLDRRAPTRSGAARWPARSSPPCVVARRAALPDAGSTIRSKSGPNCAPSSPTQIKGRCVAWAIGEASVAEIDRLNIYWASLLAMERAIDAVGCAIDYLLTDAVRIRSFAGPQEPVIKGDAKLRQRRRRLDRGEGPP